MSTAIAAIDAWAQPANGRTRELLPEVARLFEKSGSGHLLDQRLTPEQTVAEMDKAGVDKLMLAAWCRPGRWVCSNDEALGLSAQVQAKFLHENARRVFNL